MKKQLGVSSFILLFVAFLVYSTTGVFSKLASREIFLSFGYFSYFALVLLTMGIYAILWQVILKKTPLSKAFLFKSMTVLFSLCFAYFVFNEIITWKNLVGASLIIIGIIVNSKDTLA